MNKRIWNTQNQRFSSFLFLIHVIVLVSTTMVVGSTSFMVPIISVVVIVMMMRFTMMGFAVRFSLLLLFLDQIIQTNIVCSKFFLTFFNHRWVFALFSFSAELLFSLIKSFLILIDSDKSRGSELSFSFFKFFLTFSLTLSSELLKSQLLDFLGFFRIDFSPNQFKSEFPPFKEFCLSETCRFLQIDLFVFVCSIGLNSSLTTLLSCDLRFRSLLDHFSWFLCWLLNRFLDNLFCHFLNWLFSNLLGSLLSIFLFGRHRTARYFSYYYNPDSLSSIYNLNLILLSFYFEWLSVL